MRLDNIYLVSEKLSVATEQDVAMAQSALGVQFPSEYREFVTKLGDGSISTWMRVYMPQRIVEEIEEFRERWDEYYFWDGGRDVLTKERVLESVIIADTYQGDEAIFHPAEPDKIYVLPREEEGIYVAGSTFTEALDWLCNSGILTAPLAFLSFEPHGHRGRMMYRNDGSEVSFDDLRQQLLALGIHDHAVDSPEEEEDRMFELFVREFGGSLSIVEDEESPTILICHDPSSSSAKLAKLVSFVEDNDYAVTGDEDE